MPAKETGFLCKKRENEKKSRVEKPVFVSDPYFQKKAFFAEKSYPHSCETLENRVFRLQNKGHPMKDAPVFAVIYLKKSGLINPVHDKPSCRARTDQVQGLFLLQVQHAISRDKGAY